MFNVTIRTDHAAFDPDPAPEVARILRQIADALDSGLSFDNNGIGRSLFDTNGNETGKAGWK